MRYDPDRDVFTPPENSEATIWRYIDFTKLVSMLQTRSLYFARSDTLGDEFEGSYSEANVRWRPEAYKDVEAVSDFLSQLAQIRAAIRRHTYVNCWNLAEHESAALWGLYVPPHGGVAVRSTFRRLTESFLPSPEDADLPPTNNTIFVGKIRYADYATDVMPENNVMWPFVYKRRSFEFENELRALIQHIPVVPAPGGDVGTIADIHAPALPGRRVAVDLDVLVREIVVSPLAPAWFSDLVKGVCERYDLQKGVIQSDLAHRPVY